LLLTAAPALAEQRFPPPDFEGGYRLPSAATPPARTVLLQYGDAVLLLVATGVAAWLIHRRRSRKALTALSIFSVAYFGFYRNGCICAIGSIQNVAFALFDRHYALPLTAAVFFLAPLAVALFAGRAFCAAVCPHGALQDLVLLKPVKIPMWLEHSLGMIPYFFLGAGAAFAATGSAFVICRFDPFVPFFRFSGSALMLGAGAAFLVTGVFVGRPYCRFMCPYGALLRMASLFSKWRVRVTPSLCTQCALCRESCPFGAMREPASGVPEPRRLSSERIRLGLLLLLLPALVGAGAFGGSKLAGAAMRLDPNVRLAERFLDPGASQAQGGEGNLEAAQKAAEAARNRFKPAGLWFGAWVGLVIGMKLISLSVRRRRTDFEPDAGACLGCARCFEFCPEERVRLGGENVSKVGVSIPMPGALPVAWIAGLFCIILSATLIFQHATATNDNPWKSPHILTLKAKLVTTPKDERIKTDIRELDLKYRERFFARLARDRTGGWLLAGGLAVFLLAARRVAAANRRPPLPMLYSSTDEDARKQVAQSGLAVAATGVFAFAAIALIAARGGTEPVTGGAISAQSTTSPAAAVPANDLPPLAEFNANWPRFRGPDGSGCSKVTNTPVAWDSKTGAGVLWKAAIPAPGFNSPLVWGDRVFISGATAEKREVFCYDTADGRMVWRRAVENVQGSPAKGPEISEQTGYAAPTMACDGRRVYTIFGNGDLAALKFDGSPAWSKNLGVPKNQYGHATSLAIWQGKLIVQLDQGDSGPANSRLTVFDGATGRVVWEKSRPVASSWATPIVIDAAGKTQIITLGPPSVIAYSFADGTELWRAQVLDGEITPSPVFASGLVCAVSPSSKLMGFKPDGAGDVSKSHLVWTSEDNVPDVSSPATDGERVVMATGAGFSTCVGAKDGKKLWDHDFGFEVQASPTIAGKRLYVVGVNGTTAVAEMAGEFKEIGKGVLDDKFYASPAVASGRIYLRGVANLWCVGEGGAKKP